MPTSRIQFTSRPSSERFGLFAVIESKRVVLPLKGVECDFSVVSGIAEVSITQVFRQDNDKPLDCAYLFPLPTDASVFFCEADINGRTIRAQVREREEARQLVAEKKAAGFRTALVESERENLFTLSLGNIQPGDLVIVQLKYIQTLRSLAGKPSIEVPFCPGVRYIPGNPLLRSNKGKGIVDDTDEVPDASRITPVRIDAEHPDAAYIEVRGTLDGRFVDEAELTSPSHPIAVQRIGDEVRVSLADKGDVPDRGFVLRWSEKNPEAVASRAWVRGTDHGVYALLEVRAPKEAPTERAPVDFYFLVDRSGSMRGEKWNKAAEALLSCVKVLGPSDRAMITLFESQFQDFAERPLSAQELLSDRQSQRLQELGTDGGTELRPALTHVLELAARHSANRPHNLILITDAQIGNESAILGLMKSAPDLPIHCFGIDVALNDSLLLALCRQQGGTFHSLNPNDDIQGAVTALGKTLGHPVLLDLQLSEGWELADAAVPNLYAGQVHHLSARCSNGKPLGLRAKTGTLEPVTIHLERQPAAGDVPYLHWGRSRIQRLVAEGNNRAAIALSVQTNLICPLTAFVAWDDSEKVPVATHELIQPSMEVHSLFLGARGAGVMELRTDHLAAPARLMLRSAPGGHFLSRFVGRQADAEAGAPSSPGLHELELKRQFSDLCHRIGLKDWQILLKSIFDWIAEVSGPEKARRVTIVNDLFEELKARAAAIDQVRGSIDQSQVDQSLDQTRSILKSFAESLAVGK